MVESAEMLEKSILEKIPQIPYVIDQVGYALNWVKEAQDESDYYKTLKFALDVANYAEKVSVRGYYKTHLVIAALLMDIPGALSDSKFDNFKTASHVVEDTLKAVTINPEWAQMYGCFKAISIHIVTLAKENQDYFAILMYNILNELNAILAGMQGAKDKAPITVEDYIKILGYAVVMKNLKLEKLQFYTPVQEIINSINTILNHDVNF